jgi:hypothetical protein
VSNISPKPPAVVRKVILRVVSFVSGIEIATPGRCRVFLLRKEHEAPIKTKHSNGLRIGRRGLVRLTVPKPPTMPINDANLHRKSMDGVSNGVSVVPTKASGTNEGKCQPQQCTTDETRHSSQVLQVVPVGSLRVSDESGRQSGLEAFYTYSVTNSHHNGAHQGRSALS